MTFVFFEIKTKKTMEVYFYDGFRTKLKYGGLVVKTMEQKIDAFRKEYPKYLKALKSYEQIGLTKYVKEVIETKGHSQ
jgi:hypothetical protein